MQHKLILKQRLLWQVIQENLSFLIFFIICLILFLRLLYRHSFGFKKASKATTDHPLNRYLFEKQKFYLDSDRVRIKTETSDATFDWQHVVKVVETRDYLALFFSQQNYRLLPKHQLNPHQTESLHQLLRIYFRGESLYL